MDSIDNDSLPPALDHGEIVSVFDDVFIVAGAMRTAPDLGGRQFSRNMVILRDGEELTLVNTMRLDDDGLQALDRLGTVRHLVKLGGFHGRDDAFYASRYPAARVWAPRGMAHGRGVTTDCELSSDAGPTGDASAVVFESPGLVEALLVLEREGGIVVSCDCLQNWEGPDQFFDAASSESMARMFGRVKFGPGWLSKGKPTRADFQRLADLEFRHLLPGHGSVLLHDAREALRERLSTHPAPTP